MADAIKTEYMGKSVKSTSTYWFKNDNARNNISPVPGDLGIMSNYDVYFCFDAGTWQKLG